MVVVGHDFTKAPYFKIEIKPCTGIYAEIIVDIVKVLVRNWRHVQNCSPKIVVAGYESVKFWYSCFLRLYHFSSFHFILLRLLELKVFAITLILRPLRSFPVTPRITALVKQLITLIKTHNRAKFAVATKHWESRAASRVAIQLLCGLRMELIARPPSFQLSFGQYLPEIYRVVLML